jgi:hypothetical protein
MHAPPQERRDYRFVIGLLIGTVVTAGPCGSPHEEPQSCASG